MNKTGTVWKKKKICQIWKILIFMVFYQLGEEYSDCISRKRVNPAKKDVFGMTLNGENKVT